MEVFINCPFDADFRPLFRAIVFAVYDCGHFPRSALEIDDGGDVRLDKIAGLVRDCPLAIHDLSRTELDCRTRLPRFNMPFELGLFIGAKRFGVGAMRNKCSLILDRRPFRYQKFISDIAGQDIRAHDGRPKRCIEAIRNWFSTNGNVHLPGADHINERYRKFGRALPVICRELKLKESHLTYRDFGRIVSDWLMENAEAPRKGAGRH